MKAKAIVLVLILLCAILGITLWLNHKKAVKQQAKAQDSLQSLSNELVSTSAQLSEQVKTNILIQTNLVTRTEEAKSFSKSPRRKWTAGIPRSPSWKPRKTS